MRVQRRAKRLQIPLAFDSFWSKVQAAEEEVCDNSHRSPGPPDCWAEEWDPEFSAAYDAIHSALRRFRQPRYFTVPWGLLSKPFRADTAHQALMLLLNPAIPHYGNLAFLSSPGYVAVKEAAMAELRQLDERRLARMKEPSPTSTARRAAELIQLNAFLIDHHFPSRGNVRLEVLSGKQIEQHFGWSQTKVSKRMKSLFKNSSAAMKAYAGAFATHSTPKGYRTRYDDATINVEAIWTDRSHFDDGDCEG